MLFSCTPKTDAMLYVSYISIMILRELNSFFPFLLSFPSFFLVLIV